MTKRYFKTFMILICVMLGIIITAHALATGFYLDVVVTDDDKLIGKVVNDTDYTMYCNIGDYEFKVRGNDSSRWYPVHDRLDWGCH